MAKGPRAGAADRTVAAVGESVRTWRVIQGLTATQVAERAGVTRATLRALETGAGNPTWDAVVRIMTVLGLDRALAEAVDPVSSERGRLLLERRVHAKDRS